MHKGKNKLK